MSLPSKSEIGNAYRLPDQDAVATVTLCDRVNSDFKTIASLRLTQKNLDQYGISCEVSDNEVLILCNRP